MQALRPGVPGAQVAAAIGLALGLFGCGGDDRTPGASDASDAGGLDAPTSGACAAWPACGALDGVDGAQRVAGGDAHTCAIGPDGCVSCWGGGAVEPASVARPCDAAKGLPATDLDASGERTCAVSPDGGVWCWDVGGAPAELAGLTADAVAVGGEIVCALSAGVVRCVEGAAAASEIALAGDADAIAVRASGRACARMASDGGVFCWAPGEAPAEVAYEGGNAIKGVADMAAGGTHHCAALVDGSAFCWGEDNALGQLGDGGTSDAREAAVGVRTQNGQTLGGVVAVSAGAHHACGLTDTKKVHCWGANADAQLGRGTLSQRGLATAVSGEWEAVGGGADHTCAWGADGLSCWGANTMGQLGTGSRWNATAGAPVEVQLPADVSALTSGLDHTCGRTPTQQLWCWGAARTPETLDWLPRSVVSSGVLRVAAGACHTCFSVSGPAVRCWGQNDGLQLGSAGAAASEEPVDVATIGASVVAGMAADRCASYALDDQGAVWRWGAGEAGSSQVAGLPAGIAALDGGHGNSCAVTSEGEVWCWGKAAPLGESCAEPACATADAGANPAQITGFSGAVAVSAGPNHACAVTGAGEVWCWGDNTWGQLGDGGTTDSSAPVKADASASFEAVAVGVGHTCARTSSAVWCWGDNTWGQLGSGPIEAVGGQQSTPAQVAGIGSPEGLVSGRYHSCALDASSRVWCWGDNGRGQLGDGSRVAPTPTALGWP